MAPGPGVVQADVQVDVPLDVAAVDRVGSALSSAVSRAVGGSGQVVLDLADCDFVDLVGYRVLHEVVRDAELRGVAVHVVGVRASVLRVVAMLDAVLDGDVRARVLRDPPRAATGAAVLRQEAGAAAARLLGAAGAVVASVLAVFLVLGNVLADAGDEPVPAQEVREGRLPQEAYQAVELGATKEDVLTALRPVLPVDTRVLERYEVGAPETVAAECAYFDRADGRAGQQFRFCFAEDVLVGKTVVLAGDPGEGSAVVEDGELG